MSAGLCYVLARWSDYGALTFISAYTNEADAERARDSYRDPRVRVYAMPLNAPVALDVHE